MGKIVRLAERVLAKTGSALEKASEVIDLDDDAAVKLGEKLETFLGGERFQKLEDFLEAAEDAAYNRRLHKLPPAQRAAILRTESRLRPDEALQLQHEGRQEARQFTRQDRSDGFSL